MINGHDRALVDTNLFIFLLDGNHKAIKMLGGMDLFFSFITEIELLGKKGLTEKEQNLIKDMLSFCHKITYSENIGTRAIGIKQKRKIKTPDAIISATAIEYNLTLYTADIGIADVGELQRVLFEI